MCFQDDHRAFRRQLEDKKPIIENSILNGRQYLNEASMTDLTSDTKGKIHLSYLALQDHSTTDTASHKSTEINKLLLLLSTCCLFTTEGQSFYLKLNIVFIGTSSHNSMTKALVLPDSNRWQKICHRGWVTSPTQPHEKND